MRVAIEQASGEKYRSICASLAFGSNWRERATAIARIAALRLVAGNLAFY
jgi:hypothetical protein